MANNITSALSNAISSIATQQTIAAYQADTAKLLKSTSISNTTVTAKSPEANFQLKSGIFVGTFKYSPNATFYWKSDIIKNKRNNIHISKVYVNLKPEYNDTNRTDVIAKYNVDFNTGIISFTTVTGLPYIKTGHGLYSTAALNSFTAKFLIEYQYIPTTDNIKALNAPVVYNNSYKIVGPYTGVTQMYKVEDAVSMEFEKLSTDLEDPDDHVYATGGATLQTATDEQFKQVISGAIIEAPGPVVTVNNTENDFKGSLGVRTVFYENPYDTEFIIEKRELYFMLPDSAVGAQFTTSALELSSLTAETLNGTNSGLNKALSAAIGITIGGDTFPLNLDNINISISNRTNTIQKYFKTTNPIRFEKDGMRALRGDVVDEEVFFNQRLNALNSSLTKLMNGTEESYNLNKEYINSDGKVRLYNFAKGFSNMANQEALYIRDENIVRRTLRNIDDFNYKVVFEKKDFDSSGIASIPSDESELNAKFYDLAAAQIDIFGSRPLLERLTDYEDHPLNGLFERDFSKQAQMAALLENKEFEEKKNTHIDTTYQKPVLDNTNKYIENSTTIKNMTISNLVDFYKNEIPYILRNYFDSKRASIVESSVTQENLPSPDLSVSYKCIYSNMDIDGDTRIESLVNALVNPQDGTKLEVYDGR